MKPACFTRKGKILMTMGVWQQRENLGMYEEGTEEVRQTVSLGHESLL